MLMVSTETFLGDAVVRAGIGCDDARDRRSARIPSRQHTGHTGHPPALTEVLPWSHRRVDGRVDEAVGHAEFPAGEEG